MKKCINRIDFNKLYIDIEKFERRNKLKKLLK